MHPDSNRQQAVGAPCFEANESIINDVRNVRANNVGTRVCLRSAFAEARQSQALSRYVRVERVSNTLVV